MSIFTATDYATLAALVFRPEYPGNATSRGVVESPHGNGQLDAQKRYAHVATKYLQYGTTFHGPHRHLRTLSNYNLDAYCRAGQLSHALGVPSHMWPSLRDGALRVLEYPAGFGGHEHTDFDLLTVNCYRNVPNPGLPDMEVHIGELGELLGLGPATPHRVDPLPVVQQSIVYFAIPDHAAVLPSGQTVGEWISERKERSRYVK